ncbi:unnamed protein product [Clavelina lepadiformis]|uniref:Uncharacterized protein n=1 Tax=Clavelina lepadiformis TaxID=159417 RepID=A0ABP0G6U2_CLALP
MGDCGKSKRYENNGSMKASRLETPISKIAQHEYYLRSRKFNNKGIEMAGICGQNLTKSGPSRPH